MEKKFSAREYLSAPQQKNLILALVVTCTLAFIVTSSFYFDLKSPYSLEKRSADQSFDLVFFSNSFPAGAMSQTKGKDILYPTVEGQGTAVLVSKAMVGSSTQYVLLKNPVNGSTNLYKQDLRNVKIGLQQLTNSATQKAALYVDPVSGSAIYITEMLSTNMQKALPPLLTSSTTAPMATSSSRVVVYDRGSEKEIDLGEGSDPYLMPGGFFAVYRKESILVSEDVHNLKSYTLTTIQKNSLLALDPIGFQLAVYHPDTKSIQQYSLSNLITLGLKKSVLSSSSPDAIVFDNNLIKSLDVRDHIFVLSDLDGNTQSGPPDTELNGVSKLMKIIHE